MSWKLTHATGTKVFGDPPPQGWGFSRLTRNLISQGLDTISFLADGKSYDADSTFAYGDAISITNDAGTAWFAGVVIETPRQVDGTQEQIGYKVAGPWWYLQLFTFQQLWTFLDPVTKNLGAAYASDLLMNVNANAQKVTTKVQITAILQYVLDRCANSHPVIAPPFTIGNIVPDVPVPAQELRDVTCAQALIEQLRFTPDAITAFDYRTTPPTFSIIRRTGAVPVALTLRPTDPLSPIESHRIRSREDLQIPSALIHYKRTDLGSDGKIYNIRVSDIAPPAATGLELGAFVATVDLHGSRAISQKAYLEVISFAPNDPSVIHDGVYDTNIIRPWIYAHDAVFNDPKIANLKFNIGDTTIFDPDDPTRLLVANIDYFQNEIIHGSAPSWLPYPLKRVRVKTKLYYDFYDRMATDPAAILRFGNLPLDVTWDCLTTTAPQGQQTFSTGENVVDPAEPVPYGLAAYFFAALNPLQYEGELVLVEKEITGLVTLANSLNVVGGRAEWAGMNAAVQAITEEMDDGRTSITFGPPHQLGLQDLLEWLRSFRVITRWIGLSEPSTGKTESQNAPELPKLTAENLGSMAMAMGSELKVTSSDGAQNWVRLSSPGNGGLIDIAGALPTASMPPAPVQAQARYGGTQVTFFGIDPADGVRKAAVFLSNDNSPQLALADYGALFAALLKGEKIKLNDLVPTANGTRQILGELQNCSDNKGKALSLEIREVDVCVLAKNGVLDATGSPTVWKMKCWCSPPYAPTTA